MSKLKMTEKELLGLIRLHYLEAGNLRAAGRRLGVSAMHLCDILKGRRRAGPKVLKVLGLKRETVIRSSILKR